MKKAAWFNPIPVKSVGQFEIVGEIYQHLLTFTNIY